MAYLIAPRSGGSQHPWRTIIDNPIAKEPLKWVIETKHGFDRNSDFPLQFALPDVLHLEESHRAEIGSDRRDTGKAAGRLRQPQSFGWRAHAAAGFERAGRCAVSQGTNNGNQFERAEPREKLVPIIKKYPEHQSAIQPRRE